MSERKCSACGELKPETLQYFDKQRRVCKSCRSNRRSIARKVQMPAARERRLAKAREYYRLNAPTILSRAVEYRAETKDRRAQYDKDRYREKRDEIRARSRAWREANQERKLENNRIWAIRNPEKARESALASKRRRRQCPQVRLSAAVSSQIRISLVQRKQGRKWEILVGYALADIRNHLERQFLKGMSWDNYGDWHVDHILPIASFSFSGPDDPEFRACWALTNLRPLWARDNIVKRDKRLTLL